MASGSQVARTVLYVLSILITLVAIGLVASAILTSGWQIMVESGSGEIHQHGLWLDYNLVRPHVAGTGSNVGTDPRQYQWIFNYKFGDAVKGDEVHRAHAYQETTLILLSIALIFALIGALISYCATFKLFLAIGWAVFMFIAAIVAAAAVVQFYVAAMLPANRFIFTDRRLEQAIGYSFWYAVFGALGLGLAMLLSIICVVFIALGNRDGLKTERAPFTFKRGHNTQV